MLIEVAAWREREAQTRDVPRAACSRTTSSATSRCRRRPRSSASADLRSLPKGFERSKWGEAIIEAVNAGLARDAKTLPRLERARPAANGQATVELLKVLLRMTSEQHGVAAKVIATVDDLDRIAADDEPTCRPSPAGGASCSARRRSRSSTASSRSRSRKAAWWR